MEYLSELISGIVGLILGAGITLTITKTRNNNKIKQSGTGHNANVGNTYNFDNESGDRRNGQ